MQSRIRPPTALMLEPQDLGREARPQSDVVDLPLHSVRMTENLALYSRIGYVEYDRRRRGEASIVYLRKKLGREREWLRLVMQSRSLRCAW
jgi:hypothetical protein